MKLQALETYKAVHRRFPENVECLKFLVGVYSSNSRQLYFVPQDLPQIQLSDAGDPQVKLCSDMGLKEAGEFALELKKAERAKEVDANTINTINTTIVILAKIAIIITIVIIAMTKHHYWNDRSRSKEQSAPDLAVGEAVAGWQTRQTNEKHLMIQFL